MQRHDEAALNDAAREGEAGDAGEAGQPSESATLTQDEQRLASDPAPRPNILTAPGVDNANRWRPGERLIDLFWQRCDALERAGLAKTRIALEVDGVALTYAGLRDQVRRAGHALNACGLKPGARVGLLLDRALAGYGAMLAAVSAGLVYVPLDTKFPAERIAYIADDAELEAFIAVSDAVALAAPTGLPVIDAGDLWAGAPLASVADLADVADMANAASSASPLRKTLPLAEANHGPPSHQDADENAATGVGDALAYIIYTSGSTGRPKGVAVNHSAICNFIAVAAEAYGYRDDDRVYQGLTFAFDFSIEEFWVPLAVGATLVASPRDIQLVGPALHAFLTAQRITAMACVPTLLATLKDDVPDLRFLLLSGEACPPDLVRRWARPERRLLNAYGPTEATVTATWTPLAPGRAVTIGVPLATYTIVLLEPDADQLTAPGEEGEIAIAGVGLANGYVKRPELTAQKFIADFLGLADNPSGRLYRTGDWGRITPEGEIAYLGRIDSQVKLKGYRIELGEIEEAMLQLDGVAQACVAVHESADGTKDLVGYYSAFAGVEGGSGVGGAAAAAMQAPQRAWIAQRLRESLPAYMVPTYLEPLPALPLMPSQKVDRTRLPAPALPRVTVQTADHEAPATPTETRVAQVVAQVLGLDDAPSVKAHLFEDLGLDSLRAAEVIMALDEAFGDANVAIERVYRAPTIRGLAAGIDEAGEEAGERVVAPPTPRGSDRAHAVCATLQGLTYIGLFAAYIAASYASLVWIAHAPDLSAWFARSALCALGFLLGPTLLALAAKWVLIGRWRPQRLRLWSLGYVRFWFVRLLVETSPPALFRNSPVFNVYLRALGARVGDHALLAPKSFPLCTDLLTIGNNVVARKGCHITGYHAEGGFLEIGPIVLGDDAVIGENAVIAFNTGMGTGAQLAHASALLPGQSIEAGARAHGSPARPASSSFAHESVHAPSTLRRRVYGACEAGVTFLAAMLTLAAVIALVFSRSDPRTWGEAASAQRIIFNVDAIGTVALYVALAFLITTLALGALNITVARALNPLFTPGRLYRVYGWRFFVAKLIAGFSNVAFFHTLFGDSALATRYVGALGMRQPDLQQTGSNFGTAMKQDDPLACVIGSGTMVSDDLVIINHEIGAGSFRLVPAKLGRATFLGNHIAYPASARIGDNCLFASKVMVPTDGPLREGVGLLGSPPFEIPRNANANIDMRFDPVARTSAARRTLAAKTAHNVRTMGLYLGCLFIGTFLAVLAAYAVVAMFGAVTPVTAVVAGCAAFAMLLATAVVQERVMLRGGWYVPHVCTIHEPFYWRVERYWKLCETPFKYMFRGTPFRPFLFRLMGATVGRRVFDDGGTVVERSLARIGDDVCINEQAHLHGHALEDGIFKCDWIELGDGVTLGPRAYVHYATKMGAHSRLSTDSFLMKGTRTDAAAVWTGNPAGRTHRLIRSISLTASCVPSSKHDLNA